MNMNMMWEKEGERKREGEEGDFHQFEMRNGRFCSATAETCLFHPASLCALPRPGTTHGSPEDSVVVSLRYSYW